MKKKEVILAEKTSWKMPTLWIWKGYNLHKNSNNNRKGESLGTCKWYTFKYHPLCGTYVTWNSRMLKPKTTRRTAPPVSNELNSLLQVETVGCNKLPKKKSCALSNQYLEIVWGTTKIHTQRTMGAPYQFCTPKRRNHGLGGGTKENKYKKCTKYFASQARPKTHPRTPQSCGGEKRSNFLHDLWQIAQKNAKHRYSQ